MPIKGGAKGGHEWRQDEGSSSKYWINCLITPKECCYYDFDVDSWTWGSKQLLLAFNHIRRGSVTCDGEGKAWGHSV